MATEKTLKKHLTPFCVYEFRHHKIIKDCGQDDVELTYTDITKTSKYAKPWTFQLDPFLGFKNAFIFYILNNIYIYIYFSFKSLFLNLICVLH